MMKSLLFGACAYAGLTSALTITRSSVASEVQCSTNYGSGDVAPTPIPTSGITEVSSSVTTSPTVTIPQGYTRVTESAVTTTQHTSYVVTITFATVTSGISTSVINEVTTIATALWPLTSCTNDVTPVTVTEYTGTYTPLPGQSTEAPESYATEVVCTTSLTSYISYLITESVGPVETIYTTPTTTVNDYTTTATSTVTYLTVTTPSSTITTTHYSYVETGHQDLTYTACEPTVTKTMDARCAPTNLVSDYNNVGLLASSYNTNVTVVYTSAGPYGTDPSWCCQLCLENEGCGASMWGPYETCGLYYHGDQSGEPQCDYILSYTTGDVIPGQGIVVSNGCGTVEYEE
ncbi:hypothetical protein F5Y08DRAFT_20513 [Xylaria arbuscula]|nr:hypothetical protein F5Y08DRAFT_20513 [Xylaria arbuscula]